MKYTSVIILILSAVIACNPSDKKTIDPTSELVQKFKPFIHGVWVTADYMEDISKTKSPRRSSEKIPFISEFIIDTSNITADSINLPMAMGNHEGSNFILYFKNGQTKNSLLTNIVSYHDETNDIETYEIGIQTDNDTSLALYRYDAKKNLIDKTKYIKVRGVKPGNDLESGFQYLVNKKLMTGSYKLIDTTGTQVDVRLSNDGKITGFSSFKTYYILTDFVAEVERVPDQVCFDIQTNGQQCFEFKINNDSINLFILPDETDTLLLRGPLVYKLIKQH